MSPSASCSNMSMVPGPTSVADGARRADPTAARRTPGRRRTATDALAGQTRPHVTHFAAAHGVGLTGQRHRTAAGPADRAGGEVQVADGVGVPGAVGALVEPHRPAAHPVPRLGDHPCGGADVGLGQAGDVGDPLRRIVGEEVGHRVPALGVLGDEIGVDVTAFDEQVQDPVQQRQVGAGLDRQVQVGLLARWSVRRGSTTMSLAPALSRSAIRRIQDRMAVGHVGADDEEQVGAVEVGVGAGRPVGTERLLVSGARAGHAQPGVRLDVHGAQETLGQLVGQILRLDGHLTGHVERDRVGSVLVDDGPQPSARFGDRVVDRHGHGFVAARRPQQRRLQPPVVGGHHLGVRRALGAQPAEVGGVQLVAGHLRDDGRTALRRLW